MKVLHIVHSLTPKAGGNAKVAAELTESLAKQAVNVSIFTTISKDEEESVFHPNGVELHLFQKTFFARWWTYHASGFRKTLLKEVNKFDIIHIHDIWHFPCYAAWYAVKKIGKPYVITMHGTLEPWALNYKRFKKRIYSILIQKTILQEADSLHALTEDEAKNCRGFGLHNPIAIIPNGLNEEEYQNLPCSTEIEKLYPEIRGKRVILFLSRIHPKKGIDLLAVALSKIATKRRNIFLMIVGPDDNKGYQKHIESILKNNNVFDKVVFTGMLSGGGKLAALSRADIFVLPSYSEGFSMAILEAMICGLPVVITNKCNFEDVARVNAGVVIEPNVSELTDALIKLLDNPQLGKLMGENGRQMVLERFTWDKIAKQMINLYEKILLNHTKRRVFHENLTH